MPYECSTDQPSPGVVRVRASGFRSSGASMLGIALFALAVAVDRFVAPTPDDPVPQPQPAPVPAPAPPPPPVDTGHPVADFVGLVQSSGYLERVNVGKVDVWSVHFGSALVDAGIRVQGYPAPSVPERADRPDTDLVRALLAAAWAAYTTRDAADGVPTDDEVAAIIAAAAAVGASSNA